MKMKTILLLFAAGVLSVAVQAAQTLRCDTVSPDIFYRDSTYRRVIKEGTASLNCYFSYPQGESQIRKGYGNNGYELEKLERFIRSSFSDTLIYVRRIKLTGYCSIEGSYAANEKLAHDRANGFRNYLNFEYGLARRYPVEVRYVGEDWEKLRQLVDASTLSEREEVLMIIDKTDIFKGREKKLMDLNGGVPYRRMMEEFFPLLRRVEIVVEYDLHRIIEERYRRKLTDEEFREILARERAAVEEDERRLAELRDLKVRKEERAEQIRIERERAEQERAEQERQAAEQARQAAEQAQQADKQARQADERLKEQRFREQWLAERAARKQARREERKQRNRLTPLIAVKTNLYAWAGMTADFERTTFTPNLSAEVFFARRWSAVASFDYADWDYDGDKQHWAVTGYRVEPRFWLKGDGRYRWCYVGVYGQAGDFDNRSTDSKRVAEGKANCTGTYWEGGLTAGCYLLLNARWGVEAGLRAGYRSADVNAYDIELPAYYFKRNFRDSRFGLTGIEISVSYRFGSRK